MGHQMSLGLVEDTSSEIVSPFREMGAYEALWNRDGMSFKKLADLHRGSPGSLPSSFVPEGEAYAYSAMVRDRLTQAGVEDFGVRIQGTIEYPRQLSDAVHPVPMFYFQGWVDLLASRSIAVVGTRKPTETAISLTRRLVEHLVQEDYTVVSGLAKGIDTAAHAAAIAAGGKTIGVIGTPISVAYPRENRALQARIAREYLLISQVPVLRYHNRDWRSNRTFFPERNKTMSALSLATVIVEAGESSGTLIQARAALRQRRPLFILDHCFRYRSLDWPGTFLRKGAIRVADFTEIGEHLELQAASHR